MSAGKVDIRGYEDISLEMEEKVLTVPISKLKDFEGQPKCRNIHSLSAIVEIVEKITLQPGIAYRSKKSELILLDGHRRKFAYLAAGRKLMQVMILKNSPKTKKEKVKLFHLLNNGQRILGWQWLGLFLQAGNSFEVLPSWETKSIKAMLNCYSDSLECNKFFALLVKNKIVPNTVQMRMDTISNFTRLPKIDILRWFNIDTNNISNVKRWVDRGLISPSTLRRVIKKGTVLGVPKRKRK